MLITGIIPYSNPLFYTYIIKNGIYLTFILVHLFMAKQ